MKKARSLHQQILLVNITIGLLLVIIYFSSFYFLNWKTEQDTKGATIQALDTIMSSFEAEAIRLNVLTDLCQNDASFVMSTANRFDIYDFVNTSIEASSKLELLRYSLPYATNVFMYVRNNDKIIRMRESVLSVELFLPTLEKKLTKGEVLPDFSSISNGFHVYSNFTLYCKWVQNYGCIVIEIDSARFCNLNEIAEGLQSDIIVTDSNGNLFATTNPAALDIASAVKDSTRAWETVTLGGQSYQVIQNVMPRTGYKFIMVAHSAMLRDSRGLVILFSILSVVLLSGVCFLLVMLNQRIYNPLKSIIKRLSDGGGNELVAISDRFEELVNENTLISEQLVTQRGLKEDFAISYVFRSNGAQEQSIFDTLKNRYDAYYVVVLVIQDRHGRCPDMLLEVDSHLMDTYEAHTVRMDRFCHAYLIPAGHKGSSNVANAIKGYFENLTTDEDVSCFVGISDLEYDIYKLYSTYTQAKARMMNCIITQGRQQTACTTEDTGEVSFKTLSLEVQNTITQTVLKGTPDEIKDLLVHLFLVESTQTLKGFITIYQNLCSLLSVLIANLPETEEYEWKTQRNRPVYSPSYMFSVLLDDCEHAKQLCGGNQQTLRYQIIDYIKENYTKQLSLETIAEEFGITSVYLSTWFKKNVGVNLSAYLSNFRMDKAKEILHAERNIKVSELALRVGISNTSTFNRNFKNHLGVTPDQYKKLLDESKH